MMKKNQVGNGEVAKKNVGFDSLNKLDAAQKLAPDTRRNYRFAVVHLCEFIDKKPDELVRYARSKPTGLEDRFIEYIDKKKDKSPSTVAFQRDALRKFLEVNRVDKVDWRHIDEFMPRQKKFGNDRAPTVEEIRRLLDFAKLRLKALILFLSSSGARIGSLAYLRWQDVTEVQVGEKKFAQLTIYRGEKDEYTSFVTPECYQYLLEYKALRERVGEKIDGSSFVFSSETNKAKFDPTKVKPIRVTTWKNMLGKLMKQAGSRKVLKEGDEYRNYEFKQAHGFRKFFKTRMELAGVKPIDIEKFMGHSIGTSNSYYKPTAKELAESYAKAIDELTISKEGEGLTVSMDEVKATARSELLSVVGYSPKEIAKLGDLTKMSPEIVGKLFGIRMHGYKTMKDYEEEGELLGITAEERAELKRQREYLNKKQGYPSDEEMGKMLAPFEGLTEEEGMRSLGLIPNGDGTWKKSDELKERIRIMQSQRVETDTLRADVRVEQETGAPKLDRFDVRLVERSDEEGIVQLIAQGFNWAQDVNGKSIYKRPMS